jgi:hypothetical protein
MKKTIKKLILKNETIHTLFDQRLQVVQGGRVNNTRNECPVTFACQRP